MISLWIPALISGSVAIAGTALGSWIGSSLAIKRARAVPTNRRNTKGTMENKHDHDSDPLVEAEKAVAPIILTAEQWAVLEPHFTGWHAGDPRMEEITREAKRLQNEANMIHSASQFHKGLFWDQVEKLFPETKDACMHFKDDDGKRILYRCPAEKGNARGRVIDIPMDQIPPHIRAMLRGLGLGLE